MFDSRLILTGSSPTSWLYWNGVNKKWEAICWPVQNMQMGTKTPLDSFNWLSTISTFGTFSGAWRFCLHYRLEWGYHTLCLYFPWLNLSPWKKVYNRGGKLLHDAPGKNLPNLCEMYNKFEAICDLGVQESWEGWPRAEKDGILWLARHSQWHNLSLVLRSHICGRV